jgi:undecaprenyl diphosphate synthase
MVGFMSAFAVSTSPAPAPAPLHVAIILDGNGRWANKRGMPRVIGHKYGAERVREVVRAAGNLGIQYLTLFALSLDNRKRPADEVSALYGLLEQFARSEQAELRRQGARVEVVGDLGSLPASCQAAIGRLCEATADGRSMVLRLAVAYGAREDVAQAARRVARRVAAGELDAESVGEETLRAHMWTAGAPNPDLVIRTGGERRLSDFLLLEAAYAELYFTDVAWPDFDAAQLRAAVHDFTGRDRRFGLVKPKGANGASGFEGRARAGVQ